jgi:hypothetical protein
LAFTVTINCPPRACAAWAWPTWACNASATMMVPASDGNLGQDDAGVGVVCREQVHLPTVRQPCPAQQLAVHRDDHPVLAPRGWSGRQAVAQPAGQHRLQHLRVDADQEPPYRAAGRDTADEPEPVAGRLVQIGGPVADRSERARPGQHRAHRHREQAGQPVAHPAAAPRIGNRGQRLQQIQLLVALQMGRCVDAAGRVKADSVDQRR